MTTAGILNDVYLTLKGVAIAMAAVKCILILSSRQDDDQPLSLAITKCKRVVKGVAIGILATDLVKIFQKYWSRTSGTSTRFWEHIVGGLNLLLEELRLTIILIDTSLTIFYIIKNLLLAMKSGEDKAMFYKKVGTNLVVGIGVLCGYWLIITILNYFV